MSGYVNPVFRPDFTDYPASPVNRLATGFWPTNNPVGTETTQGMQSATPTDQIAFMRPDGTPVMASDMAAAHQQVQQAMRTAPTMALGMMGTTDPAGIRAFHGSPYDFERFDTSKIGTGEGAQAYGHGLYFAEKEGTAQTYRDNLTPTDAGFNAMDSVLRRFGGWRPAAADVREAMTGHDVLTPLADNPDVVDAVRRLAPDYSPSGAVTGDALRHYRTINDAIEAAAPKGSMYEVNIGADPEQFLHWDKPLSEQSPQVKAALQQHGIGTGYQVVGPNGVVPGFHPTVDAATSAAKNVEGATGIARADDIPGQLAYYRLAGKLTGNNSISSPEAAQALRDAGIPGIRYLDQGSRSAGEGTHNYVVFDANTIDILRKYGLAGLGIGLGATAAGTQQQSQ